MGAKIYSYLDLCDETTEACVVTIGGVERAFHRNVGTSVNPPTAGVTPGQQDVAGITYQGADAQGKTIYTACERAISRYISDNYAIEVAPAWALIYTAPSDGVIRIGKDTIGGAAGVRINDVDQADASSGNGGEVWSSPYNLATGDEVKVNFANDVYITFLPDDYP